MFGDAALRRRAALILLIGPFAFGLGLLRWIPTGWARARVAAALSTATQQPVALGGVRIGLLGGVTLSDLHLGDPAAQGGAWLQARAVDLDLNLWNLLRGRIEPGRCRASGVALRVRHQGNGQFEWSGLLARPRSQPRPDSLPDGDDDPEPTVALELADATVTVLDAPTGLRLDLTGVQGRGGWSDAGLEIERLSAGFNGGRVELAGRLDRGGPERGFEGQLRIQDAGLTGAVGLLSLLAPALAGAPEELGGTLDLDLKLCGRCDSLAALRASVLGQGGIQLSELGPEDSRILAAITQALHLPARDVQGSLQGNFLVADQKIATRDLTLRVGPVPVRLEGWTGFDGQLDYTLHTEAVRQRLGSLGERLPAEARRLLDDLPPAVDQLATLRLQGDLSRPQLTADGVRWEDWVEKAIQPGTPESEKLRELGKRLRGRDRLTR